ncbi:uncharacterized protein LOC128461976 [Scomber scombrus]|uniref:Uncharacterized protein LOC128461976 n=1 Tax=Scomber scombrus TaxID=13677 RepID=A0AAV1N7Z8_SCOSC
MKSSPKRPRTRQQSAIQQDEEPFASDDDDKCESWNATAALPDVKDRRFVKVYDIPRHNPSPALGNHSQSPAKPHPYQVNADSDPGAVRPSDVLQSEKETENSPETETENSPEKEIGNSPEKEIGNSPEKETENSPEKEKANLPGMENQNVPEMETHNLPGDLPDTSSEPVEGSLMEPEAKDHTEAEIPTQEKTEEQTEADIPAGFFGYPEILDRGFGVILSLTRGMASYPCEHLD